MNIVVLSVQRDTCIIPEQARSGRDACRWPGMISDPSVAGPGLLIFPGGDDITTTTATTKRTRPRPEGLATWRERGCRWKKRGKKKGKLKRGREKEARRCFRTNGNGHAIEKAGSLQFAESSPSPRGSFSVSLFTLDSPRVSLSLSRLFVRSFFLSPTSAHVHLSFVRVRSHFISSAILLRLYHHLASSRISLRFFVFLRAVRPSWQTKYSDRFTGAC